MVGANDVLEVIIDDHAGSLCARPANEGENARPGVGEGGLEETDSDRYGCTAGAESATALGNRPGVGGELF